MQDPLALVGEDVACKLHAHATLVGCVVSGISARFHLALDWTSCPLIFLHTQRSQHQLLTGLDGIETKHVGGSRPVHIDSSMHESLCGMKADTRRGHFAMWTSSDVTSWRMRKIVQSLFILGWTCHQKSKAAFMPFAGRGDSKDSVTSLPCLFQLPFMRCKQVSNLLAMMS